MLLLVPVTHPMIDGVYALNQRPAITAPATPVATADKTPTVSPTTTNQTTANQTPASSSSGTTPTSTTTPAQPVCVTTYSHGPWQMVREERQAVGQWDLQWLHYERTVTDRCTGDSWTETKVEGPFQLWQSVPDRRVSDVNRPDGPVDGLSGNPLRSSSLPASPSGGVGPNIVPQDAPTPVAPAQPGTPFFPSALLLIGALVAAWQYRRRKGDVPENTTEPRPSGDGPLLSDRSVSLPVKPSTVYTVVPGDTLSEIAERYGLRLDELLRLNPQISNPDLIFPGGRITLGALPTTDSIEKSTPFVGQNREVNEAEFSESFATNSTTTIVGQNREVNEAEFSGSFATNSTTTIVGRNYEVNEAEFSKPFAATEDQDKERAQFQGAMSTVLVGVGHPLSPNADVSEIWRQQGTEIMQRINRYDAFIEEAAAHYGLDPLLIKAIITRESKGNPRAVGSSGDTGLMQIVWSMHGFESADPLYDPETNIQEGAKILAAYIAHFHGDMKKGIQAYNVGCGNVEKMMKAAVAAGRSEDDWMDYRIESVYKGGNRRYFEDVAYFYDRWREAAGITTVDTGMSTRDADMAQEPERPTPTPKMGTRSAEEAQLEVASDEPQIEWIDGVSSEQYQLANRGVGDINCIVIHSMAGTYPGTIEWFGKSPEERGAADDYGSAHYLIGSDGHIGQMVADKDIAYHVRNFNSDSIGIELEDKGKPDYTYPEAEMKAAARLVRSLCEKYNIPMDAEHIRTHASYKGIGGNTHVDPAGTWDMAEFIKMVQNGV